MVEPVDVSVVVATRNRALRLAALLDSLRAQDEVRFELLVVDDASTDDTASMLQRREVPFDLRIVGLERTGGPAVARNAGWRHARAQLVAFTDDDCVAGPGWLAALVRQHHAHPAALIQGRTEPMPEELQRLNAFARTQRVDRLGPNFQTCNIAYPREVLERLEGFDEAFSHFGEDADLAWRAIEAGTPAVFAPDALTLHAVHPLGAPDVIRGSQRWADLVRAFARHPGLRRELFVHRIFWKIAHERLLLALAGLLAARRTRGLSLALVIRYARLHRQVHPSWAETLRSLPAHAAIDAAETAAMLRGSLRFRTLVL